MGVGDGGEKRGKQIIRKKQQAASSGYGRKISSHLEKNQVGSFEFLKHIMGMGTEQTVCLERKMTTLKEIIAAILSQTNGSPGPIFCVPSGSVGKSRNKTSIYGMFPVLSPNLSTVFSSSNFLNCMSFLCLITPSRFLFQVLVQTVT